MVKEVKLLKKLYELTVGDVAKILKITATDPLKSRLYSLGLNKGEIIRVLAHTLVKNTYAIEVNSARIALRSEEAKMIIVDQDI